MQSRSSKNKSTSKKVTRRVWFWIIIGLVIVVAAFFTMLPVGINYGIERYLKGQGADQATLEDVNFNPLTGRLTLTNLSVKIAAQPVLKISEATLNIEWAPFIRKRFVLKRLTINDTELKVEERADGRWQVGGIMLPDKNETSEPSAWDFSFQAATVNNSKIKFISSQLTSDLKIEHAKISNLTSWMPERSARLEFKGQFNDGRLQLQVDVSPFANEIMAAGQIQLKGLTLIPFAQLLKPYLKTLEGRLDADLNFETRQTSDTGISHHQKGLLNLYQIRTQIEDTDFSNEGLAWDGALRIDIPKSADELKIAANGRLNGSRLTMVTKSKDLQIQQESLNWKGKVNYGQTSANINLNLDGALTLQNAKVNGSNLDVDQEMLNWKGTLQYSSTEKAGEQRIIANGNLASGPLTINLLQENLNLKHAGLDWQGKLDYAQEKTSTNINADGQMRLLDVKMESPEVILAEEKLSWNGTFQFSSKAETDGQRIIADGTLDGGHLLMNLLDQKLNFEHADLAWKGRLDSGETNDLNSLSAEGDFRLKDVQIHYPQTNVNLLNSDGVALQAIKVKGIDDVRVSDVTFKGLNLVTPVTAAKSSSALKPLFSTQKVTIQNIQLVGRKNLSIDSVRLEDIKALLHRNQGGQWPAIDRLETIRTDLFSFDQKEQTAAKYQVKPKTASKEEPTDFGFRIRQLEITGDNVLRFEDESVSPAFRMDLSLLEAGLSDLNSRKPEQPTSVKLKISDTEHARILLNGTLQPFADRLNLDWIGKIESLKLPPLSPYVIQSTGYSFVGGEMHADIPLKITQNELNGEIDLTLYNPRVKRVKAEDPEKEKKGKIQLNMPLDSALKLLRDKQNNVKLKIPINGDISDPKFSVADAINRVLAQTLQKSTVSYLKFMLGPYGIGIAVAELAVKSASKIRLNPILFAPRSAELDEAAIDYLQRVAAILKEHPAVQVSVCGVATERDRAALSGSPPTEAGAQPAAPKDDKGDKDKTRSQKEPAASASTDPALLALAKKRSERIKDQLVKLHGIAAKRIIACKPEIDRGAEAKPRVDLAL